MSLHKTARQMQAEQTKLEIFNAAMRLLETQDFNSITVRDIVREANVSIGSFYNSYRTKLDVFYETYQIADNYFESIVRPNLSQSTAYKKIQFFFEQYAIYNGELTPFALTKVLYNSDNTCFHRPSKHGIFSVLKELINQAKDCGEFQTDQDADAIAQFLLICIRGVVYDWCICDGAYNLTARVNDYVSYLLKIYQ